MESTAEPRAPLGHRGQGAGAGNVLRLHKSFQTATSPVIDAQGVEGNRILFGDMLNSTMQVPASGSYELHAQPLDPADQGDLPGPGRDRDPERAQPARQRAPAPLPPCPVAQLPTCVARLSASPCPDGAGVDNAKATFSVTWGSAASDYDIEVYEDTDANGVDTGDPARHLGAGHHERGVDHCRRRRGQPQRQAY